MAPRTLLIGDLAAIVGGELRFGSLPPLAGTAEPIRRIVLDHREVEPGDVFWAITAPRYVGARRAEAAFLRGALGVVVSGRHVEPWAGRFSLRVLDANAALLQLNQVLSDRSTGSMSARAA
jgi:UDP-N-acetylmuramyl pentapeptide synthase